MNTHINEIASGLYRLSTHVSGIAPPAGFTFNQFLIDADEPLLFHCGHRAMFKSIAASVARIMPLERLRWISFSHLEADECGAMNQWLALAPEARVAHGMIACRVSLDDLADRPPRTLANGEVVDLGGKRIRYLDTPHVPHGWDAGLIFEESTGTLCCSDLLGHLGDGPALTDGDIVGPAINAEAMFESMSLHPLTVSTLRRLAALRPRTLALMHGSSFNGDCTAALEELAADCERRQGAFAAAV